MSFEHLPTLVSGGLSEIEATRAPHLRKLNWSFAPEFSVSQPVRDLIILESDQSPVWRRLKFRSATGVVRRAAEARAGLMRGFVKRKEVRNE